MRKISSAARLRARSFSADWTLHGTANGGENCCNAGCDNHNDAAMSAATRSGGDSFAGSPTLCSQRDNAPPGPGNVADIASRRSSVSHVCKSCTLGEAVSPRIITAASVIHAANGPVGVNGNGPRTFDSATAGTGNSGMILCEDIAGRAALWLGPGGSWPDCPESAHALGDPT